jgi:WD40 repeat protein
LTGTATRFSAVVFERASRISHGMRIGIVLAILTGAALYSVSWYASTAERDDAWRKLAANGGLLGVAFNPAGTLVAAGGFDDAITVWDVATGQVLQMLRGHTDRIYKVVFAPDGERIVSGSKDGTTRVWSTRNWRSLVVLRSHTDRVMALAFASDGRSFVTGSRDATLKLWDAVTYRELRNLQPRSGFISAVAFAPDPKMILFGDWNGNVKRWRLDTDAVEAIGGPGPRIRSVACSSDGRILAAVSGAPDDSLLRAGLGQIRMFDATTGAVLATLREHRRGATAIAFSPDVRTLATAGKDGAIILWDVHGHVARRRLLGHSAVVYSLAYSPDGRLLASASGDGSVRLWRVGND